MALSFEQKGGMSHGFRLMPLSLLPQLYITGLTLAR